jgi:hypothetical protein
MVQEPMQGLIFPEAGMQVVVTGGNTGLGKHA